MTSKDQIGFNKNGVLLFKELWRAIMPKLPSEKSLELVKKAREGYGADIDALIKEYQGLIAKIAAKFPSGAVGKHCGSSIDIKARHSYKEHN